MKGKNRTIIWGESFDDVNIKTGEKISWHINSLNIDKDDIVHIALRKYGTIMIKQIRLTIEEAERIGLFNWDRLAIFL